jgi:hypothetical protein
VVGAEEGEADRVPGHGGQRLRCEGADGDGRTAELGGGLETAYDDLVRWLA